MKKFILAIALLLACTLPVMADETVQVFVNGSLISSPGQMYGERVFVPLRAVSEALGAKVSWDGQAAHVTDWGPLKRPAVVGDAEFVTKVTQALDLLEQKDFPHYALICQLGWPIERVKVIPGGNEAALATIMRGKIVILDLLVNNEKFYNQQFIAGVLVHEASHAISNKHDNWSDIVNNSLSEKVAYENELAAFKLIDAPLWMQDQCIR